MKQTKLSKFQAERKRLMQPHTIQGVKITYAWQNRRLEATVKNANIDIPRCKGPFPKKITDHCKTCPKIYCSGWTIEIWRYFIIWHCPKFTVQEKNKWGYIL